MRPLYWLVLTLAPLLFVLGVLAATPARASDDAAARAALALAEAEYVSKAKLEQVPLKYVYEESCRAAMSSGKPLVIGVRCVAPHSTGEWLSCNVEELEGYQPGKIVVCRPGDGWLVWVATMGPNASKEDIRAALGGFSGSTSHGGLTSTPVFYSAPTFRKGAFGGSCAGGACR